MMENLKNEAFVVLPATAERWPDVEMLFGGHGAFAGCWCMYWRLNRTDFKQMKGDGTKAALRDMIYKNQTPGLLAFEKDRAVGWCSLGPRESYAALENSRILKRIDDQPVWSIVCFFVAKASRRKGVLSALLHNALRYAKEQNAIILEGYPIDITTPKLAGHKLTSPSGCMGIASVFREAGFIEVGRASETQLIMRCYLEQNQHDDA